MPPEFEALQQKNRNFICSCQKAYLSYAALFTHIKQKHGGKAPGQIVRPRSLNKRGRPRKNDKLGLDKGLKYDLYERFTGNNNLKNINFDNESYSDQYQSQNNDDNPRGFTSYKDSKRFCQYNSYLKRPSMSAESLMNQNQYIQLLKSDENQNMEFTNPNCELSSNTLALASIIIDINCLELVRDEQLQIFSSYFDLKKFHSKKLNQKPEQKSQEEAFLLGNIVCAFLNFCHQILQEKIAYKQIVLLMVCLLQHIKNQRGFNFLVECRKGVIHECLPSFFQSYLQSQIIKSKLKFSIFKQNNSFKLLSWFLNWLAAIEANYLKNIETKQLLPQDHIKEQKQNSPVEDEQGVQFEHPTFFKEALKGQTNEIENKGACQIVKQQLQNDGQCKLQKEQQQQKKINSQQKSDKMEEDESQKIEQDDHQEDEQGELDEQIDEDEDEPDNENNEVFGIERLSSQVR